MAADRKYSIARPLQEVRLRKWKPGNVAQFKQVITALETELNQTMAAQIAQGGKRKISNRVPKIVGLTIRAGFKNFQLNYQPAKGLKDLLFYEIQKSTTLQFSDESTTTYTIPQVSLTIPARVEFQEVYFRVRCVNSKFEAGVWSDIVEATARSFFMLEAFQSQQLSLEAVDEDADSYIDGEITDITPAQFNTWVDVGGQTYSPSGADVCAQVHVGVQASCVNHFTPGDGVFELITNDVSVAFRVVINDVPTGDQGNMRAWGYQQRTAGPGSAFTRKEFFVYSTLFTGFESYDGTEALTPYRVQAKVLPETCSSSQAANATPVARTYDDNVRIHLDFVTLLELIQSGE